MLSLHIYKVKYAIQIAKISKLGLCPQTLKFFTQTSKTTNTRSNMLDLFFYKLSLFYTGSPRRSAPRDDDFLSYVIARKSLISVAIHKNMSLRENL